MNLKNTILDSVMTLKDKSLKITLITRELDPKEMANIFLNLNKEVLSIDIPEDVSEEPKSKSQRLRHVLYRLWEQEHKNKFKTFSLYYDHLMEQLINIYKEKLR